MRSLRSYLITALLRFTFKRQKPGSVPLQQQRDDFLKMMRKAFKQQPGISYAPEAIGGVNGEWARHEHYQGQRTILYFHGGGYVLGCAEAYRDLTGRLAVASGAAVFAADYRLAPENPFPAALEDATACYRALLEQGVPPGAITIAGDSAGGGLTLATLLALKQAGDPLPGSAICLSPWTDLAASGKTMTDHAAADPMLTPAALADMANNYAQGHDLTDPRLSPLYGDLEGLPPLMVQVGSTEILLDDSRRIVNKALEAGGQAKLDIWNGMPHVWHMFAGQLPEGRVAIDRMGEFIRAVNAERRPGADATARLGMID